MASQSIAASPASNDAITSPTLGALPLAGPSTTNTFPFPLPSTSITVVFPHPVLSDFTPLSTPDPGTSTGLLPPCASIVNWHPDQGCSLANWRMEEMIDSTAFTMIDSPASTTITVPGEVGGLRAPGRYTPRYNSDSLPSDNETEDSDDTISDGVHRSPIPMGPWPIPSPQMRPAEIPSVPALNMNAFYPAVAVPAVTTPAVTVPGVYPFTVYPPGGANGLGIHLAVAAPATTPTTNPNRRRAYRSRDLQRDDDVYTKAQKLANIITAYQDANARDLATTKREWGDMLTLAMRIIQRLREDTDEGLQDRDARLARARTLTHRARFRGGLSVPLSLRVTRRRD